MNAELNNQTAVMRRYILGELPESEQFALEEQFFRDEAIAERMRNVEQELVDAYVRGRLAAEERSVFERNYLTSPRRVERVEFARELLKVADETPAEIASTQTSSTTFSVRKWIWDVFNPTRFSIALAAASALIVVSGIVWILIGLPREPNRRSGSLARKNESEEEVRALGEAVARLQEENRRMAAEIERLRNGQAQTQASPPPVRPSLASILLLPTIRGAARQQTLPLSPDDQQARLQMKIETGPYKRYLVEVQPVDGGASWRSSSISAQKSGNDVLLTWVAPARRLKPGDYTLTLTGVDAAGSLEPIENYSFRVVKR